MQQCTGYQTSAEREAGGPPAVSHDVAQRCLLHFAHELGSLLVLGGGGALYVLVQQVDQRTVDLVVACAACGNRQTCWSVREGKARRWMPNGGAAWRHCGPCRHTGMGQPDHLPYRRSAAPPHLPSPAAPPSCPAPPAASSAAPGAPPGWLPPCPPPPPLRSGSRAAFPAQPGAPRPAGWKTVPDLRRL